MSNLRNRLKDQRGFNLIELMIVIAIIGLLIGVGSLAWQAVIRSGNETTAAQTVNQLRTYQAQYAGRNKGNFATFEDLVSKMGLDETFRGTPAVKNGYAFVMTVNAASGSNPAFYSVVADPVSAVGVTASGTRHFYTDSSLSTIKGTDENRPAKPDDPSI